MDSSDLVTALRLLAAVVVLSYASLLDWRTRKIGNAYWIGLSVFGLALIPVQLGIDDRPMEYLLVVIPILAILSDVYWEVEEGTILAKVAPILKYTVAIVAVVLLGYMWVHEPYFQYLLAVPVMMLFIVLLYVSDVVRGGADAKALLALAILFPSYPTIGSLPIIKPETDLAEILLPFAFVVLVTAAIIVAFFPLGFTIKNLSAHEFRFPQGLVGYKMDVTAVKGRHAWLMERIEKGDHKIYTRPKSDEDLAKEVDLLIQAGLKRVWVTPKIPFIIPMLVALVFSTIFGNILLLFQA